MSLADACRPGSPSLTFCTTRLDSPAAPGGATSESKGKEAVKWPVETSESSTRTGGALVPSSESCKQSQ